MTKRLRRRIGPWTPGVLAASLLAVWTGSALAQGPVGSRAVGFGITPPLDQIEVDAVKPDNDIPEEGKTVPLRTFRSESHDPDAESLDPVVQESLPVETAIPGPLLTFPALTSDDNQALLGGRVMPPDTVGDVGPDHYVQMVNNLFRVYDKSGTAVSPIRTLGSLWASLPGPCANRNDGDPIVLYDPLADRWMLSQFCTVADPFNHQLIAISQTGDPTGAYFVYDFVMPNNKFNDYPHFGVWNDAYYMTDNQFNQAGTAFLGAGVFAFDRAKMLAGDPTAGYVYFDVENGNPNIGGMLPADLDGVAPPAVGTPGLFAYFTADEFTGPPLDGIRIFEFRPDFANPAASTFTERAESPVAVAAFDPRSPAGRDDIEQPPPAGSGAFLDAIADRYMHRLAYRNFGTHESLVVNHTVNVSGVAPTTVALHQAGVRYYEFRRNLPGGAWTVAEQATFAPDTHNRWMGSAAMDNDGNLAVGYSVSSLTLFPSLRYAGRLASDPPNGLFQGETTLLAGTGSQTATQSRWGDYSSLNVDPVDDCTFWYTTQYYTAASAAISSFGWLTAVGNFTFPSCTPAERGTLQGTVVNAATNVPIPGATVRTGDGYVRITGASGGGPGAYSMGVAAGTYSMTASAPGYGTATASGVTVSTNGTTIQNFALSPMPILMTAGGSVVTAESCSPASGAIDPGETVTVSLAVKNVGTAATVNLVGTLLPTGGVTAPGAPQAFGVVPVGGTAARPFTFTAAGTCGGTITVSLQLQDGASNLGTVTYTFTLGKLNPLASNAGASTGNVGVPLPDVTTVEIPLVVGDFGAVQDANVRVRLNHTFTGDLVISLVHPDGTVVILSNRRGGGGDNFGTGANDCSGTKTVFDDEAAATIGSGTPPYAGSFRPDEALSALDGKPTAGTWKLRVSDQAAADIGTLFCWDLELERRVFVCCGVPGTPDPVTDASAVVGGSCSPDNGAIDPDETVQVSFALNNAGSGDTSNLVATLLPTGGVLQPSGPQTYGVVPAGGPAVSRTFTFVPTGTCGGTVTATLQLQDGTTDFGTVSYDLRLGTTVGNSYGPFANPASITIPNSGNGIPYPSTIAVAGVAGTVSKVRVALSGFTHTFPDDVDVLLAGPAGQRIILLSDAGGSLDVNGVNLVFDDAGAAVPDSAQIVSGTFRPTNFGTGDVFPAPAPGLPHGAALAAFNGSNPNGTWSLFVVDDAGGDLGSFAGGWSLSFDTADPVCCTQACSLSCPAVTQGNDPNRCDAQVFFARPGVTGSCGTIACVPPSGSIFPLGVTNDVCTATTQGGSTTTCTFPVTVEDVQMPVITGAAVNPATLWVPNHQMQNVSVTYSVGDNCSSSANITCNLAVASDEPVNGTGDGDAAPDWQVVNPNLVRLRAERAGTGDGRVYTITITCTDQAGRSTSTPVTVTVPHNQ